MRTKKAFYNVLISMIYQVVSIICGLITPRLILAAFGSTYNGVVASATQLLSIISVLTLGIAGATRVALYPALAKNDILAVSRIMKATKQYMRKVAMGVIIYAILLMIIYPYISHNSLSHVENALIIGIVSIATFAEYLLGQSNHALLSADQSLYVINFFNIIALIANTVLTAVLIKSGCSIFIVKLSASLVFLATPIIINIYIKRKYRLISNCEPDNTGIKNRGAVAFHSIANIVHTNTDLVILTVFTDAKIISVYTVYYLVLGKIKSIMNVFTQGMEAAFGNMWVKKEYEALDKNFHTFEFSLHLFTSIMFSCVAVLIIPFITLYTKGVNDTNYILYDFAYLACLAEAMYCVRQPYLILVQATGSYEETKIGAGIEAALNLSLSLIMVNYFGIIGVIVGTLVANIFRTIQYAYFVSNKILKYDFARFLTRLLCLFFSSFASIIISNQVLSLFEMDSWINWLFGAIATFLVAFIVNTLIQAALYRNSFKHLLFTIKRMLISKKGVRT